MSGAARPREGGVRGGLLPRLSKEEGWMMEGKLTPEQYREMFPEMAEESEGDPHVTHVLRGRVDEVTQQIRDLGLPEKSVVQMVEEARERDLKAFRQWFNSLWNQDDSYGRYVGVMQQTWLAALAWERDWMKDD